MVFWSSLNVKNPSSSDKLAKSTTSSIVSYAVKYLQAHSYLFLVRGEQWKGTYWLVSLTSLLKTFQGGYTRFQKLEDTCCSDEWLTHQTELGHLSKSVTHNVCKTTQTPPTPQTQLIWNSEMIHFIVCKDLEITNYQRRSVYFFSSEWFIRFVSGARLLWAKSGLFVHSSAP